MKYAHVFLIGVLFLLVSCADRKENQPITETYPVTSPIQIDTNTFIEYVADIAAVKNIEIRAKATGYLEKVHVDEGSYVTEGQLLFSINNREYSEALAKDRALLKMARAEAKNAELELENTKKSSSLGIEGLLPVLLLSTAVGKCTNGLGRSTRSRVNVASRRSGYSEKLKTKQRRRNNLLQDH